MTAPLDVSLETQRRLLREQLLEQRAQIEFQLGPRAAIDAGFPRSMTMRLIIQRPALAGQLALRLLAILRRRR